MEIMFVYNYKFSLKKQRLLIQEKINNCKIENFQINSDYLYQFHFEAEANKNLRLPSLVYFKEFTASSIPGTINKCNQSHIEKNKRKNIDLIPKLNGLSKAPKK